LGTLDKSATTVDKMLADNVGRLDNIFHNVESITGNLNRNQEQINTILANLSALTDSVKRIQFAGYHRRSERIAGRSIAGDE
jgi:ABC-type transporter Mla subunit MlaD